MKIILSLLLSIGAVYLIERGGTSTASSLPPLYQVVDTDTGIFNTAGLGEDTTLQRREETKDSTSANVESVMLWDRKIPENYDSILGAMTPEELLDECINHPEQFDQFCGIWILKKVPVLDVGGFPMDDIEMNISKRQLQFLREARSEVIDLIRKAIINTDLNKPYSSACSGAMLRILCDLNGSELLPDLVTTLSHVPFQPDSSFDGIHSQEHIRYYLASAILILLHQEDCQVMLEGERTSQKVRESFQTRFHTEESSKGDMLNENQLEYTLELEKEILELSRIFLQTTSAEAWKKEEGIPQFPRY
ncbi:MAG: hypothetical protein AB7H80_13135 [Candidatus Kapaibacterium sp.]